MMVATIPLPSLADECRDVLSKCDAALRAEQDVNATLREVIASKDTLIELQEKKIESQSIWKPIAIGGVVVIGVETLILILRK